MTERADIWQDPMVREVLKEGRRQPWQIQTLRCPKCEKRSYYNEGSHFTCRFCEVTFIVISSVDGEQPVKGFSCIDLDSMCSVEDVENQFPPGGPE